MCAHILARSFLFLFQKCIIENEDREGICARKFYLNFAKARFCSYDEKDDTIIIANYIEKVIFLPDTRYAMKIGFLN